MYYYYTYNTHTVYCTGDMAWHVYLALVLAACHFLNIFASKVSRKNKGKVSQFFVQSVTNDTSTLGWVPQQWFSTWGTRVICDTFTKNFWHFAFIFMWHSWSKNIIKMTPRQNVVVNYWLEPGFKSRPNPNRTRTLDFFYRTEPELSNLKTYWTRTEPELCSKKYTNSSSNNLH